MRKLSAAYVATTILIAVAGSAFAQTAARPAGTSVATSGAKAAGTAQVGVNRTSGNANQAATSSTTNGIFTTTTTTNADGTTSTTISNGLTNNSAGVDGSRSGNNTNSSAANAPLVSSNAKSSNTDTNNANGTAGSVVVPGIINSTTGGISSDGQRIDDTGANNQANGNGQMQNNGSAGASVEAEAARSSKNLDRAIKQVERDRKKIGRNGQLLQSIAPRTGADRSNEMPDDGPTPALTGSSSALTLR